MPLLPSTQTKTANGVPLYVPMDGEGNASVPGNLTVDGVAVANSVVSTTSVSAVDGDIVLGAAGGFPSISFTNGILNTLVGLQSATGPLLVGNNQVAVAMTGALTTAGTLTSPKLVLPVGVSQNVPSTSFIRISNYGFLMGLTTTGGDGVAPVQLPVGQTGVFFGGAASAVGDIGTQPGPGGTNNFGAVMNPAAQGVYISTVKSDGSGALVQNAGVYFIAVFQMNN